MRQDEVSRDRGAPTESETTGYRPVSTLAIAALVLGVLSGLALVGPFFFVVPLVAVAVAVAALADVALRQGSPGSNRSRWARREAAG